MATPEEQKSKLQASRARIQNKQLSATRFEMGRKHFGVEDTERPGELLHTQATRAAGAEDLFDVGELEAKRKASLFSNRLQNLLGRKPADSKNEQETSEEQEEDEQEEQEQQQQNQQRSSLLRQAIVSQMMESKSDEGEDEKKNASQDAIRKEVKKKAKAAFRRGMIIVIDLIAAALDLGTSGISFIIDFFVYIFTFGWLNLEMIYGTHIAKRKSKFISPLSWDPIPMPVDPNGLLLQGFVIAADIALGVAVVIMGAGGMCLLHDYVQVVSSPIHVGTGLASGGTGDLCLGGIISLMINGL